MQPSDLTPEELASLQGTAQDAKRDGAKEDRQPPSDEPTPQVTSVDVQRQLEVLEAFHQDVASRFADSLSRGLQRLVEVQLVQVEAMVYSQFAFSRPNPTCYAVLQAEPLPSALAMDVAPDLLYPILDCLLGGGKQPCPPPDRAPTELEQRLARRVIRMLLDELHDAWEPLLAVDLSINRIESHAQRVRVVSPGDPVIVMVFQVRVAEQTGDLALCLPQQAIRKILDKLLVGEYYLHENGGVGAYESPAEMVEVVAQFNAESLLPIELEQLRAGDVILTEVDAEGVVDVCVDDQAMFRARPGAVQGRRAVVLMSKLVG